MLTHDQLAFAITQQYPELVHGRDFWVAQPVAPGSSEPLGEAEIVHWPKDVPQPDHDTLRQLFTQHAARFDTQRARQQRNAQLRASDWTQLPDMPETIRQAWGRYRQALRDLPQQPGFPQQIHWPQAPEGATLAQTPSAPVNR